MADTFPHAEPTPVGDLRGDIERLQATALEHGHIVDDRSALAVVDPDGLRAEVERHRVDESRLSRAYAERDAAVREAATARESMVYAYSERDAVAREAAALRAGMTASTNAAWLVFDSATYGDDPSYYAGTGWAVVHALVGDLRALLAAHPTRARVDGAGGPSQAAPEPPAGVPVTSDVPAQKWPTAADVLAQPCTDCGATAGNGCRSIDIDAGNFCHASRATRARVAITAALTKEA